MVCITACAHCFFLKRGIHQQYSDASQRRQPRRQQRQQRLQQRRQQPRQQRARLRVELPADLPEVLSRRIPGTLPARVFSNSPVETALVPHSDAGEQSPARFAGRLPARHAAAGRRAALAARPHRLGHVDPAPETPGRGVPGWRGLPRPASAANPRLALHGTGSPQSDGAAHVPEADAPVAGRAAARASTFGYLRTAPGRPGAARLRSSRR